VSETIDLPATRAAGVHIRPYRPADQAQVIALWQACNLTRPWNDPAADIAFCVASPAATLLVAEASPSGELAVETKVGSIVGSAMVGHDGHRGWVYYVAVHPGQQRSGLGAVLMVAAERWLKAHGVGKLQLMVRDSNLAARGFYEKLGYKTEPVVTMSKWLRKPPVEPDGH
jgi:ribosomal protein S18 acetylase RimI-like enzyme